MEIIQSDFGVSKSGERCTKWVISNGKMSIALTNLGATVLAVNIPNKKGTINVSPCHQSVEMLQHQDLSMNPKMGTTCGRVCNRTAASTFELEGKTYNLVKNDGENHLHGGLVGFDSYVWKFVSASLLHSSGMAAVTLEMVSPSMDEGYPGKVTARCIISLSSDNTMGIEYSATVEEMSTPLALTNHCYWNLDGFAAVERAAAGSGSSSAAEGAGAGGGGDSVFLPNISDHTLQLHCDEFVTADGKTFIPTGGLAGVDCLLDGSKADTATQGHPFDFRQPVRVGDKIKALGAGFNVSYVVKNWKSNADPVSIDTTAASLSAANMPMDLHSLAKVHSPSAISQVLPSGKLSNGNTTLDIATSAPCIHLYTCFAWDPAYSCEGTPLAPTGALALECQFPADTANRSFGHIPRSILTPGGAPYSSLILHRFSW